MPAVRVSCRTAGEGDGRTARVYVSEESHRGILPMKHSNKDGTLSAESAEGRPRLKENALHLTRTRLSAGLSVSHGVSECADRLCLAAIYPREEPDALRSARPDLCGGHRATGVPTAIANNPNGNLQRRSQRRGSRRRFAVMTTNPLEVREGSAPCKMTDGRI
jgi:hypothetical protein